MNQFAGIKEIILGMLYPRRCPICQNIVRTKGGNICVECKKEVKPIVEPRCKKCGKPLSTPEQEYCYDCTGKKHYYECGIAVYLYEKKIKKSVHQMKYYNKREYIDFYVEEMVKALAPHIQKWGPQAFIPIPMHWRKKQKRGFNQAELLANGLSKAFAIPVYKRLLKKVRNTISQKELSHSKRQNNLKNAFKVSQNDVELNTVILVDDVYTTGSTIDMAAKVLLEAGIHKVYYVSLCIGMGTT